MNSTKQTPPMLSAMLKTRASSETPSSPNSETKWFSGLYDSPLAPV